MVFGFGVPRIIGSSGNGLRSSIRSIVGAADGETEIITRLPEMESNREAMMQNPKTTILGWLSVVAAGGAFLFHLASKVFAGDWLGATGVFNTDWPMLAIALQGIGLIHASDGAP
jgi:hypothetical protein